MSSHGKVKLSAQRTAYQLRRLPFEPDAPSAHACVRPCLPDCREQARRRRWCNRPAGIVARLPAANAGSATYPGPRPDPRPTAASPAGSPLLGSAPAARLQGGRRVRRAAEGVSRSCVRTAAQRPAWSDRRLGSDGRSCFVSLAAALVASSGSLSNLMAALVSGLGASRAGSCASFSVISAGSSSSTQCPPGKRKARASNPAPTMTTAVSGRRATRARSRSSMRRWRAIFTGGGPYSVFTYRSVSGA